MATSTLKRTHSTAASRAALRERADQMLRLEPSYIHSRDYESLVEDDLLASQPESMYSEVASSVEEGADVLGLVTGSDVRLLTPAGETFLFRCMNYYRYRFQVLRARLSAKSPRKKLIEELDLCLRKSQEARSALVQANVRLVASLAQKFSNSRTEFDELVSEGNLILVNAIDKFDIDRGFRFSTYATHAVQRHYFRVLQRLQRRRGREVNSPTEILAESLAGEVVEEREFDPQATKKLLAQLADRLDEREQQIITARYALQAKGQREEKTLKTLAQEMGLSKERVRQLQYRALDKLRALVLEQRLFPDVEMC
ncbi:MAG: sigma-70 family RNA polymerase sigma factor [Planctomycetaceae bacterium]|nr:sigma-70 family RNA polymerase sigma factor [Planctomycetaceae bacterium]